MVGAFRNFKFIRKMYYFITYGNIEHIYYVQISCNLIARAGTVWASLRVYVNFSVAHDQYGALMPEFNQ